jgi:hypothetical protein
MPVYCGRVCCFSQGIAVPRLETIDTIDTGFKICADQLRFRTAHGSNPAISQVIRGMETQMGTTAVTLCLVVKSDFESSTATVNFTPAGNNGGK